MEKYFDEATQEIMYEWVVNSVNSDGCSSGVYRVMATRSQLKDILHSFADDEKRRGSKVYEEDENFSSTKDGSIYEYTVDFNNGEENWIEVTAYLVEKMNVFYAKDFIGGEQ